MSERGLGEAGQEWNCGRVEENRVEEWWRSEERNGGGVVEGGQGEGMEGSEWGKSTISA